MGFNWGPPAVILSIIPVVALTGASSWDSIHDSSYGLNWGAL